MLKLSLRGSSGESLLELRQHDICVRHTLLVYNSDAKMASLTLYELEGQSLLAMRVMALSDCVRVRSSARCSNHIAVSSHTYHLSRLTLFSCRPHLVHPTHRLSVISKPGLIPSRPARHSPRQSNRHYQQVGAAIYPCCFGCNSNDTAL